MKYPTELITIRDFIRFAASRFNEADLYYGHGTDNAWDEAVTIVLHSLFLHHAINPTILDARLTEEERLKIYQFIVQRIDKRIPVAYLTHQAWFAGLPFYVDERVLVPRSPLAELIQNHFQPWVNDDNVNNILDLCTGSGCIAIACAHAFPQAEIDASDISQDALAVAKINVMKHGVEEQITLYHSDLFAALPAKKYDVIVSNPPYVSAEEMFNLPLEYDHEPSLGLHGGKEGLDFAIRILQQARDYLNPHGILIVEVGNSEQALIEQFPDVPFTWLEFEHGDGGVFLLTAEQLKIFIK